MRKESPLVRAGRMSNPWRPFSPATFFSLLSTAIAADAADKSCGVNGEENVAAVFLHGASSASRHCSFFALLAVKPHPRP